jgi:alanine racemase
MNPYNKTIIDTDALAHNYRFLCRRAPSARMMAMVKSDGYGHSMVESAKIFRENGCRSFGVAELSEGVELRDSGCQDEIIVFMGFDYAERDYLLTHNLTPVVFRRDDLERISRMQSAAQVHLPLFLKFDCGMSRLGFKVHEAAELFSYCRDLNLTVHGVISHYPSSDEPNSASSAIVLKQFEQIIRVEGYHDTMRSSLCNSGGILYHGNAHGGMVRAGISLFGYYPDGSRGRFADRAGGLKPAMKFVSRVLQINEVASGTGVSYGHTFVTDRETRLAVIPVGYSDGYFRTLSNRASVLIKGSRAPIRGRICMNMCMADVTDIEGVQAGDEVVLMGTQGAETIDADEIGGWCDTISYELLCAIGNNNTREFI